MRKRGAKPKVHGNVNIRRQVASSTTSIATSPDEPATATSEPIDQRLSDVIAANRQNSVVNRNWEPSLVPPQAVVMDLTEIYIEVVYPVFPLFHRPTLLRKVSRGEYLLDRPFYACIMAMCSLASARARDGALYSTTWDVATLTQPSAEEFYKAADDALPRDDPKSHSFNHMRACVLLAISSIQLGDNTMMSFYLGIYNTLMAVGQLHDEANWPQSIGNIELEERRRLVWSTYTLDVFTSIIWSRPMLSREATFNVCYPTEADDETFNDAGYREQSPAMKLYGCSWMRGWNFVIDLYRILEHAVDHLRCLRSTTQRSPSVQAVFSDSMPSQRAIFEHIMSIYSSLPTHFKTTRPIQCNLSDDLFSFQAANITATVQLVRMVHFINDHSALEQKCQVASEVIAGFVVVPVAYLRAMGSPLLHHLAGIGSMLGAAFEDGLSEKSYRLIRVVLLDLADLIANLEVDLFCPPGTSDKLRTQVSRIDEYMATQRSWMMAQLHGERIDHGGRHGSATSGNMPDQQQQQNRMQTFGASDASPQYHFPPELFEDWSWALNLTS